MKKILLTAMSFMLLTLSSNAAGIGYVDYSKIQSNYSLAKKYTADINSKINAIRTYASQKEAEIAKAKTNEQKASIRKSATAELNKKRQAYSAAKNKYEVELTQKINNAVQQVRAQKKLDIVLNKDSVVSGGIDITQNVLAILK